MSSAELPLYERLCCAAIICAGNAGACRCWRRAGAIGGQTAGTIGAPAAGRAGIAIAGDAGTAACELVGIGTAGRATTGAGAWARAAGGSGGFGNGENVCHPAGPAPDRSGLETENECDLRRPTAAAGGLPLLANGSH